MAEGPNFIQLKEMLTIVYPEPSGNINISGDNLKRIMTLMGFEFMIQGDQGIEDVRQGLDAAGTGVVKIDDFAHYLEDYVAECTNEEALV